MKRAMLVFAIGSASCGSSAVDAKATGDYTDTSHGWKKLPPICGELPGHGGDTCRVIYANDVAQTFEGGAYREGTVLVKEIRDPTPTDGTGALQYVAIMRRTIAQPTGFSDDGGWLFTYTDAPQGSETQESYCYAACHVAAPYGGAWLDYSK